MVPTDMLDWTIDVCTVDVIENVLRCTSRAGYKGSVDLADILCVLPQAKSQLGYLVLFLMRMTSDDKSNTRLVNMVIPELPDALIRFVSEIPSHLRHKEPVQVIISTRSGTGTAKAAFQDIVQPFLTHLDIDHQVYETQSAQTIVELSQLQFLGRACEGAPQTILLLSGDGGLIDIVDVFYKSTQYVKVAPNIALIPCGTGNAMANSIGLHLGPVSGLAALLRGKPCPLPVFAVKLSPGSQLVIDEGRKRAPIYTESTGVPCRTMYGAVVASWGLHAALVADSDTEEYRRFGAERFKMAAKELLYPSDGTGSHRYQGKITLTRDGKGGVHQETIAGNEHMYVLATLVPQLEKDFVISPDSEPLDGQMRLLRFGPLPSEEAMRLMTLAYQGGLHVLENPMTYTTVEQMRIEFREDLERWRRVCIDGKIVAVEKGGWMELGKEPRQLLAVIKPGSENAQ
ncbi:uncharacterized protein N7459_000771 [Penicillium hispanicum]|uniref:uncharacterized protein n=1 Tax=Penicillium hispanicum TaxID=1080232 RepID=UPI0025413B4A|nr:uncharacterized protein N7459_000771 [Penicillium hispanicum]KAJ5594563.1 hypothetical protein N7459_000771 [Penicillium hispanicum]